MGQAVYPSGEPSADWRHTSCRSSSGSLQRACAALQPGCNACWAHSRQPFLARPRCHHRAAARRPSATPAKPSARNKAR
eukprot:11193256-Lingulodinium_polyedra.AAC.1